MNGESGYSEGLEEPTQASYRRVGFTAGAPLAVVWDIRDVDADSEEGRRLGPVQAAAIRKVLECLRLRESQRPDAA